MVKKKESDAADRKLRVQFDANKKDHELMDKTQKLAGFTTRSELIRTALKVYTALIELEEEWATVKLKEGGVLLVQVEKR